MRVVVVGAGQVGHTVVKSLYATHECTVVDVDAARLEAVSHAYDVRITRGNGARRETLLDAGVAAADLVLACTSRDEVNLVTAVLARRLSSARTVVRHADGLPRGLARGRPRRRPARVDRVRDGRRRRARPRRPGRPARRLLRRRGGARARARRRRGRAALDRRAAAGRRGPARGLAGRRGPARRALGGTGRPRAGAAGRPADRDGLAAAACLGNAGPSFGAAGPFGSYAAFGDLSTVLLTGLMFLGRIEIVPLVVLPRRADWRA